MGSTKTLLHIDGDAFFASVYQATHAEARGRPVVIGYERGIATAFSYEAKAYGVKRGMLISQVKRLCPGCIIASSDYRIYQLFSNRIADIVSSYSPYVERYSIDEVFADMTGLDHMHQESYEGLGRRIKQEIETALGITVSVGIGSTKTIAKIASSFYKPSGFLMLTSQNVSEYRTQICVQDIWGIGPRLAVRLKALGIYTAEDFVQTSKIILISHFPKPVIQTWYELQGVAQFGLSIGPKTEYQSIQKTRTLTPPTTNPQLLLSRIFHHIESAFSKARKLGYQVEGLSLLLKTQSFHYYTIEVPLPQPVEYPYLIRSLVKNAFTSLYKPGELYRTTGCTLYHLHKASLVQEQLFDHEKILKARLRAIYPLYEKKQIRFGSDLFETHRDSSKKLFKLGQIM
ncbi:hypothetical protein A3I56_02425 [Candidatus Roizmanbacteria bacterium RIFCSPLOWO2_02_FULL_43_10]|uniref:UmuC domain-containing protein n=3 Tax=Candidatus Roizmaniibacteriota TaxID=1752723 RepID=A0A1F7JUN5_9BACT|nr:MAG: hypothetical protein A3D08_01850 [Candidatus Roizmanbacteria bacterium RIFCSPHIGHO2_02_FULL_43_11]OGK38433.1 MAG: hypothetical protein A3F32_02785 [Candidatus Roizmanbacteria bacterium RIFCSPHIGHO2_12_FULL_42_10]OGK59325.1 MAG: hypothetical protein A3I56_02425 [Candidatus Roizmanbacteria bacterium RIFCSPLOWO2_02_FULL_43_10]